MKNGNDIKIMHPDRTGKSSAYDDNSNNSNNSAVDSRSKSTSKTSSESIK